MGSNQTNTHYYDCKIGHLFTNGGSGNYQKSLNEILDYAEKNLNKKMIEKVQVTSKIVKEGSASNIDMANNLNFEHILPAAWQLVKKNQEYDLFFEQFTDILKGKCAQGRTTRILQVYLALKEL